LGGYRGDDDASDVLARPGSYWVEWLARGTKERFSPQPYQMIARLLREAGYPTKANAVLYAARKRERGSFLGLINAAKIQIVLLKKFLSIQEFANKSGTTEPQAFWHPIYLWTLYLPIGFGIGRYFLRHVAGWLLFWTGLGTLMLQYCGNDQLTEKSIWWKIAASLDRLIPFAELIPRLSQTLKDSLTDGQQLYFAGHSLVGWVLAAMVVAGLAGLTQRA
tara:strand:+ start:63 stop:722 length:660 start_codon:yes stop_codon:yes gene_type:complete